MDILHEQADEGTLPRVPQIGRGSGDVIALPAFLIRRKLRRGSDKVLDFCPVSRPTFMLTTKVEASSCVDRQHIRVDRNPGTDSRVHRACWDSIIG
nr:hypothetical protein CFP56_38851 [Quercus suber]